MDVPRPPSIREDQWEDAKQEAAIHLLKNSHLVVGVDKPRSYFAEVARKMARNLARKE